MSWTIAQVADAYRRQGLPNPVESACAEGPVRSKYGAKKTVVDGIAFASKAEAETYQVLKIAQEAGIIADLELQPRYLLQEGFHDEQGKWHRKIEYVGDFRFIRHRPDAEGRTIVVDTKGMQTQAFRMKWKMVKAKYPTVIFEQWHKAGQIR